VPMCMSSVIAVRTNSGHMSMTRMP
jgi:hypothetical protein